MVRVVSLTVPRASATKLRLKLAVEATATFPLGLATLTKLALPVLVTLRRLELPAQLDTRRDHAPVSVETTGPSAMTTRQREPHVGTGDNSLIRLRICPDRSRVLATSAICTSRRA